MSQNTVSLRRRHLVLAGVAGVITPATIFAGRSDGTPRDVQAVADLYAGATGADEKVVVSGRILAASHSRPLADAIIEAWHGEPGSSPRVSATTDADGRFMLTTMAPAGDGGRPQHMRYRVTHRGHETPVRTLHFARARAIAGGFIAQPQRDDAGVWRAALGITLA